MKIHVLSILIGVASSAPPITQIFAGTKYFNRDGIHLSIKDTSETVYSVLPQMTSIQTWLASTNCTTPRCEAMDQLFAPSLYYSKCPIPVTYQGKDYGLGLPTSQQFYADVDDTRVINQLLYAAFQVDADFPAVDPDDPESGVLGLGPQCRKDCNLAPYEGPTRAASMMTNLYSAYSNIQDRVQTFFYGINYAGVDVSRANFYQQPQGRGVGSLIPIVRRHCSCDWSFSLASNIIIYDDNLAKDITIVRPAFFTIDQTKTFNIVSQRFAEEYAKAFSQLNPSAVIEESTYGDDLVVFRIRSPPANPLFPSIRFDAVPDGASNPETFAFEDMRGLLMMEGTVSSLYLPFAYSKNCRYPPTFIWGWVGLSDSVPAAPAEYTYPRLAMESSGNDFNHYVILRAD